MSFVCIGLSIVALFGAKQIKPRKRSHIYILGILGIFFALGTIVPAMVGIGYGAPPWGYFLGPCGGDLFCSLVFSIWGLMLAQNYKKRFPFDGEEETEEPEDNGGFFEDQIVEPGQEVVLFTASANIGIGLWTAICKGCAAMFGVESKNYTKKMNRAEQRVRFRLTRQMLAHPEYEYSDFRIVKDGNLAYSGSVIGKLKKE